MELEILLPYSQEPATGPSPEPYKYIPNLISLRSILLFSHLCLGLPSGPFPLGFAANILKLWVQWLSYGMDDQGSIPLRDRNFFLFVTASRPTTGPTQSPNQCVPEVIWDEIKRPALEGNHSSPSSAEFTVTWSCTSTPSCVFMAWCLVKHKGNCTLYFVYFLMCAVFPALLNFPTLMMPGE